VILDGKRHNFYGWFYKEESSH